jgi:ABC-type molybdate transport system substrate-binding protein
MTSRRFLVSFLLFGLLSFAIQGQGYADELKIFTSRAVATVLEKIGPEFEKGTGHKLNLTTGLSSEFVGRINAGEPFDVVAAPPPVLDSLANSGKIAAESKTGLVRSANGVAIRTGRRSQTSARWKTSSGRCWTQNRLHIFLCPAYRK